MLLLQRGLGSLRTSKIKAHLTLAEALALGTSEANWLGNRQADESAERASGYQSPDVLY